MFRLWLKKTLGSDLINLALAQKFWLALKRVVEPRWAHSLSTISL